MVEEKLPMLHFLNLAGFYDNHNISVFCHFFIWAGLLALWVDKLSLSEIIFESFSIEVDGETCDKLNW
jgi:hypothetical protein